ncbi:aminoglycoside phosphotransferase family protein [Paracoccus albus]|uniref:aminoglycoside phosphotransferase family protein n=1 Tax=Paracoccus albus TaxID=3017784 RepID=UPI0022F12636|nr:aminoglycoside phosphotransferase family protein [Paracoccus albus]WBU61575.1 fructosamine kinase family protein [Paracoccus albus]
MRVQTSLKPWLSEWHLVPDGPAFSTHHARLMPVLYGPQPAMLKVTENADEIHGGAIMEWWNGQGAARVLKRADGALLLERAQGGNSLADMARNGDDDEACRIICAAAQQLHLKRPDPPVPVPIAVWFRELRSAAATHGGLLAQSWRTAEKLLATQDGPVILHGDLHHDNVLDFGQRGWLAIDPKGIYGDRAFDYANIFTNPDLSDPTRPVATRPGVFQRRLDVVCKAAGIDRLRLLQWILAWTGLSAAWFISDNDPMAEIDLRIAELAAAEIATLTPPTVPPFSGRR